MWLHLPDCVTVFFIYFFSSKSYERNASSPAVFWKNGGRNLRGYNSHVVNILRLTAGRDAAGSGAQKTIPDTFCVLVCVNRLVECSGRNFFKRANKGRWSIKNNRKANDRSIKNGAH